MLLEVMRARETVIDRRGHANGLRLSLPYFVQEAQHGENVSEKHWYGGVAIFSLGWEQVRLESERPDRGPIKAGDDPPNL